MWWKRWFAIVLAGFFGIFAAGMVDSAVAVSRSTHRADGPLAVLFAPLAWTSGAVQFAMAILAAGLSVFFVWRTFVWHRRIRTAQSTRRLPLTSDR